MQSCCRVWPIFLLETSQEPLIHSRKLKQPKVAMFVDVRSWLKMHQHFSTNIKHGATYALQDLFNVKLKGENLKVFLSNWDQVLAGIQKVPDENVLETLFLNQIKNSKNINHDLQEYFRAEDGSSTKSYDYLITAVRRFLERERLEVNRERIARNLGASSSTTAPSLGDKVGYIPKRILCQVE